MPIPRRRQFPHRRRVERRRGRVDCPEEDADGRDKPGHDETPGVGVPVSCRKDLGRRHHRGAPSRRGRAAPAGTPPTPKTTPRRSSWPGLSRPSTACSKSVNAGARGTLAQPRFNKLLSSKLSSAAWSGVGRFVPDSRTRRPSMWSPALLTESMLTSRSPSNWKIEKAPFDGLPRVTRRVARSAEPDHLQLHVALVRPEPRHGMIGRPLPRDGLGDRLALVDGILHRLQPHPLPDRFLDEGGAIADREHARHRGERGPRRR